MKVLCLDFVDSTESSISNSQSSSVHRGGGPLAVEEFFSLLVLVYSSVYLLLTPYGEGPSGLLWGAKAPVVASSAVASHCPLIMRSTESLCSTTHWEYFKRD